VRVRSSLFSLVVLGACTTSETVTLPLGASDVIGDGSPGAAKLVSLYAPKSGRLATDLEFNPESPHELWVVLRETVDGSPCNEPPVGGYPAPPCALLGGTMAIITDADRRPPKSVRLVQDPNAWHFMRLPPALAFGAAGTFATCGEARTGNWDSDSADFIGPTLWPSDPKVFGIQPAGKNGSHIDMLHATPFCMGIAHEQANVYWLFNGNVGALDRYDFHAPHEVGGEDHSDGEASRWGLGELSRVPGVPSHLVYDPRDGALYVADTGHGRVVRLDTTSGRDEGTLPTDDPQMPEVTVRVGTSLHELVPPGVLEAPSGIALEGDILYITDNGASLILAVDLEGKVLGSLDTGLPRGTLAGITIGPDGRAYLADVLRGVVRRVEVR
jgi:hypothetical protein